MEESLSVEGVTLGDGVETFSFLLSATAIFSDD